MLQDNQCLSLYVSSPVVGDIEPCSPLKVNQRFGGIYRLYLQDTKITGVRNRRENRWQEKACTLKTEAICRSETSIDFQRTKRLQNIPENSTLDKH
jgi:hypothetical protein